jgi:hypothetical protein
LRAGACRSGASTFFLECRVADADCFPKALSPYEQIVVNTSSMRTGSTVDLAGTSPAERQGRLDGLTVSNRLPIARVKSLAGTESINGTARSAVGGEIRIR